MKSGFYNLKELSLEQLRALYKEVLANAHLVECESKYVEHKWRGKSLKYSIEDFLERIDKGNHNVFIDRSVQHDTEQEGEVGFKLNPKYDKNWHQITFKLSLERLRAIADSFQLVME